MLGDLLVSAQQAAHKWLREMILSGELPAGQALRQEEIARRLGISRLPIREALNRLATEGLVELKPRRGFYVASLNIDEIEDIFEMRAMLEARAGHLATERMTAADADAVDRCVAELDAVVATSTNFDHYAQLNIRFHERLFESCARKHLRRQIAMLRDAVSPLNSNSCIRDGRIAACAEGASAPRKALSGRTLGACGRAFPRTLCVYGAGVIQKLRRGGVEPAVAT